MVQFFVDIGVAVWVLIACQNGNNDDEDSDDEDSDDDNDTMAILDLYRIYWIVRP